MEKTQSASISIIDRFAGADDPRTERAGKRELGDIIAGENGIRRTPGAPFGYDGSAVRIGRAAENVATDFLTVIPAKAGIQSGWGRRLRASDP